MKKEFKEYLESIGLSSKTVEENIALGIRYATKICKEEIKDIFVADYYKDDGSREYGSLWFISEGYLGEVRNFRSTVEYDVDVASIKCGVVYMRLYIANYDLESTSKESRVRVRFINQTHTEFEMMAASENCNKLMEIIDNNIKPKM